MTSSRYIAHTNKPSDDLWAIKRELKDALAANIQRVQRHNLRGPDVYVGEGGRILMGWTVSALVRAPLTINISSSRSFLRQTDLHVPRTGAKTSFLETSVGHATLLILDAIRSPTDSRAHVQGALLQTCANLIERALQVSLDGSIDHEGCEVLYGRAGLLYALLLLRTETLEMMAINPEYDETIQTSTRLCADANLQALIDDIVKRGQFGAELYKDELDADQRTKGPPLMWAWHGKRYLGGAHGVAGILQMLLSAPSKTIAPHWGLITGTCEWLLAIQEPLGNWPSKAGRHMYYAVGGSAASTATKRVSLEDSNPDALVQWCHGAPGVLILLSTLLLRTEKSSTLTLSPELRRNTRMALQRGAELVYVRGLLRKGVGLCHGVAGSVYALVAVPDALDSGGDPGPVLSDGSATYWLARAAHLAHLAIEYQSLERRGEMRVPDEPYSLYEGVAGMCCAWAQVVARIDGLQLQTDRTRLSRRQAGMPGYNDLLLG